MWTCVIIAVLCHSLVQGFDLPKFKFEENCGTTLQENVGSLSFTGDDLRTYDLNDNQCSVTVKILPSRSYSTIMFYFERFELSRSCKDENLTITQQVGSSRQTTTRIPGLADTMCGKNNTLLLIGLNFTTSGEEFTFTYSFDGNIRQSTGHFSIKFLEFHTGMCEDEHLHKCVYTDRCVLREYHCSSKIRACPLSDRTCTERTEPLIVTILKVFGVLVFLGTVCYLPRFFDIGCNTLRQCTERKSQEDSIDDAEMLSFTRERAIDSTNPTESVLSESYSVQEHSSISSNHSDISSETPYNPTPQSVPSPDLDDDTGASAGVNQHIAASADVNHHITFGPVDPVTFLRIELGYQGPPSVTSSYSDVSLEQSDDNNPSFAHSHLIPPPSYDELMAPSYEDVLANTAKYQTSLL